MIDENKNLNEQLINLQSQLNQCQSQIAEGNIQNSQLDNKCQQLEQQLAYFQEKDQNLTQTLNDVT